MSVSTSTSPEVQSHYYSRAMVSLLLIFTTLLLGYLILMQYVIAPQVRYTQVCHGFVRDQDLIMMFEGSFLSVNGETLYIHNIACQSH